MESMFPGCCAHNLVKNKFSELSENKENSQTQQKIIYKMINQHMYKRKMKKILKKAKIIVDIGKLLRYNVTR